MAEPFQAITYRDPRMHTKRFARQAQMRNPEISRAFDHDLEQSRMRVQMMMAIDMVERQTSRAKFFELSQHFRSQLFAQVAFEKVFETHPHGIRIELLVFIHKTGNLLVRQSRMAAQES